MGTISLSATPSILLSYALLIIIHHSSAGRLLNQFIYPNFTASNFQFIGNDGTFLQSLNGTFEASIYNPYSQFSYYLCILHVTSHTVIWCANRDRPISASGFMNLTPAGFSVYSANGTVVWSTGPLRSSVTALRLLESGNLELLDGSNGSLWSTFDHPTDTIVIGQRVHPGTELASSVSDVDPSKGNYRFHVSSQDAVLQWLGQQYWRLSMDKRVFKDSNWPVDHLLMNRTGLFLFGGGNGSSIVVWQLSLPLTEFSYANLDRRGRFNVYSVAGSNRSVEFTAPADVCQLPLSCGRLGLCEDTDVFCSCPGGFGPSSSNNDSSCWPLGGYDFPPPGCSSGSSTTYLELQKGVGYFENGVSAPAASGISLASCRDLCSGNCSCLGLFYTRSSSSCYLIKDVLGSLSVIKDGESADNVGYIKMMIISTPPDMNSSSSSRNFPLTALIFLPCAVAFLLVLSVIVFLWWRRSKALKTAEVKLGRPNSTSSAEDIFSIPGLPVRFNYEELEAATENFRTQIGSGGFGAVYKGTLPDKTLVAVKMLSNIGIRGKREFCTEIAVIGNIHHVNLVKLRGFCAHGQQRLLVYEYMNRGSLDRSLFGQGPVLEWHERMDIALGTARGLAYLHGGCELKIIHCDVKPENILLHDQQQVKISDFGLAKLMSPEQSNLFTTLRGTRGYLAPEWLTNSAISDRTDVYSYGMVLLEIVRGRKNSSNQGQSRNGDAERSDRSSNFSPESAYFPLLALEMHEQGRYLELADPRLEGRAPREEVEKLVRIALCCVHEEPILRPNMANVVAMLEGATLVSEPRVESLNFLRFYGRRFTEPSTVEGNTDNRGHLYPLGNTSLTSSSSGIRAALSYLSSQQVSGPR